MPKTSIVIVAALLAAVATSLGAGAGSLFQGSSDAPALAAAEVKAATAQVTGDPIDCPPTGAGPEDSQALDETDADTFRVIGTLSSFDGATAVVTGPSGDVSASLAPDFELAGDLSAGDAVEMKGVSIGGGLFAELLRSVCDTAGIIDCQAGTDSRFALSIENGSFELTGVLDSLSADTIKVLGPGLLVEASVDASTDIEGGIQTGEAVTVTGSVLSEAALSALDVDSICAEAPEESPSATPTPSPEPEETPAADECDEVGENAGEANAANVDLAVDGAGEDDEDGDEDADEDGGEDANENGDLSVAAGVNISADVETDGSEPADDVEAACQAADAAAACNEEDEDRGHGNDCDHDDEDNPGRGRGNHGARENGDGDSENEDDDGEGGGDD